MEKLQTKLFEAAIQNSIASLHQLLLKNDPLLLDRALVNPFNETPLHVAAMLGNLEFVEEIIGLKPELVNELNSQLSSPLHLAAAKGHVDVVRALLSVDKRACLIRDRNELLPLHLAASKGRVKAMKVLLQAEPDAAMVKAYGGESILHLCVKSFQLEAFRLIVQSVKSDELLNSRDDDGNTALHLAVADKQVEAIKFLVSIDGVKVNAVNLEGLTPLDVLIRSRRNLRDSQIEKSLKNVGGFQSLENNNNPNSTPNPLHKNQEHGQIYAPTSSSKKNRWRNLMKRNEERLEKHKSSLMVVASLIATVAFQVAANPPGGVWQDDATEYPNGTKLELPKVSGDSVFAYNYPGDYEKFCIATTVAFMASLSIILFLMSGLPVGRRFFKWILMAATWAAITALAGCYLGVLAVLTPAANKSQSALMRVLDEIMLAWVGLMALLLIGHTVRVVVKIVKTVRKAWESWRRPATLRRMEGRDEQFGINL